jgi:hypothetical protein
MKKFIVAAVVFIAAAASVANARDDEPSWEAVEQYARNYMQQLKKEGMSERETANQLASSIWWSEKLQLTLPILLLCERAQGSLRLSSTSRNLEHDVRSR